MRSTWNSNTVRAGKWLGATVGALALFTVSSAMREYILALGTVLAFVTTYHAVAAMRCKLATKKDFWAGLTILLMSGAIFVASTVVLWNAPI